MEPNAYAEFRDEEGKHWWFIGRKRIFSHLIQRIVRHLGGGPIRSLDLGCGMGGMLDELANAGSACGTDIEQTALVHCRERGYAAVFKAHGEHLPLPDGSLDLICAFDTLEHIAAEQETIEECFRVLRPGGFILLSVPAYQLLYSHQDKVVHHQRRYTDGDLARKLTRGGFRVTRLSYINFLLFPAILPVLLLIKLKEALFPPANDADSSNVSISRPAPWLNNILAAIFAFERHLVGGCSVPVGHSLVAVGRKPGGESAG